MFTWFCHSTVVEWPIKYPASQYTQIKDFVTLLEPVREKTNNLGFRPGLTQTGLFSHRTLLEAGNFVFK